MAIPFSSAAATSLTAKTNAAKALLLSPGPYSREYSYAKCFSTSTNAFSWSFNANYVRLQDATGENFGKSTYRKNLMKKSIGIWRCATNDEIQALKSLVEKNVKQKMEKAIETVRSNLNTIRTGRANPAMLDWFEIEYNGSPMHLKSIAEVSAPDGSSIMVQPFEKSRLKAIEKAIVKSYLDFTPNNDGEVIILTIPPSTRKRRKELPKIMAKRVEEGKNAIRNIRREGLKAYEKLEKEKKLSKDNVKDLSSDLQKLTDEYIKKIDAIYKQEKELLEKV